jgi:hypothetical protein
MSGSGGFLINQSFWDRRCPVHYSCYRVNKGRRPGQEDRLSLQPEDRAAVKGEPECQPGICV